MGANISNICDCQQNTNTTDKQLPNQGDQTLVQKHEALQDLERELKFAYFEAYSHQEIKKSYIFEKKIGRGHYGSVYKAHSIHDIEKKYAVKAINKYNLNDKAIRRLQDEIEILKSLDHPHLPKYYATFVDKQYIYIVMELCAGGEVFEKVQRGIPLKEPFAAKIVYQVLLGTKYLEEKGVCHRDLKPENIMFVAPGSEEIKIIDFGLSKRFDPAMDEEEVDFSSVVGTPFYVAPEVLTRTYNQRCDAWSIGVIIYILLSTYPPFNGTTSREVLSKIKKGDVGFDQEEWDSVSQEAKDLIQSLLKVNVDERLPLDQALNHQWFVTQLNKTHQKLQTSPQVSNSTMHSSYDFENEKPILQRFKRLLHTSTHETKKLQRLIMEFIVRQKSSRELEVYSSLFKKIDSTKSGTLNIFDFSHALKEADLNISYDQLKIIFYSINYTLSGAIKYTEFLIAIMQQSELITSTDIKFAFACFDIDKNGYITSADLQEFLKRSGQQISIEDLDIMIFECFNFQKKISFEDFNKLINKSIY